MDKLNKDFEQNPEAMVKSFRRRPMRGVGRAGGFTLMVQDRGALGSKALQAQDRDTGAQARNEDPSLARPVLRVSRQRADARRRSRPREVHEEGGQPRATLPRRCSLSRFAVRQRLQLFGRTWQVLVQAEHPFRDEVEDISKLKVRNCRRRHGSARLAGHDPQVNGPLVLTRYNMYPAASITGAGKPGVSSRDALDIMEQLANANLPSTDGLRVDRDGLSGTDGRQHGDDHFRLGRGRWCSWCWPRSTKAGRCRWP